MGKNILIVSAHPDDETLGAGGTLLRHRKHGDTITWVIVTNISTDYAFTAKRVESRQKEIEQVSDLYRFEKTFKLDYPTMSLSSSSLQSLIGDISKVVQKVKPHTIYTMNRSDAHSDHRVIFDAVMACTKSFRYPFIREVLMYECISETEFAPALSEKVFLPNCFVDISDEMEEKLKIMNVFASELGEHPFPRSEKNIRALATFRGAMAGVEYAEAFQILKSIRFHNK